MSWRNERDDDDLGGEYDDEDEDADQTNEDTFGASAATFRAGEDTEEFWKAGHDSLYQTLEAEKRAFLQRDQLYKQQEQEKSFQRPPPQQRHAPHDQGSPQPFAQQLTRPTSRPTGPEPASLEDRPHVTTLTGSYMLEDLEARMQDASLAANSAVPAPGPPPATIMPSTFNASALAPLDPVPVAQHGDDLRASPLSVHNPATGGYGMPGSRGAAPPVRDSKCFAKYMSNYEIDLVIRMHNKQLESTRPFIDDYYLHEFNRRRHISDGLLESPNSEADRRSFDERGQAHGFRHQSNPAHTPANSVTLERSLGTLQSWTPKAPRRIVDVVPMKVGTLLFQVGDDRVAVRALIELCYDKLSVADSIQAKLHGYAAGNQQQAESVFSLLGLDPSRTDEAARARSENFFLMICSLPKGKRLLARTLPALQSGHQAMMCAAVMRHLSFLCKRTMFSDNEWREARPFWQSVRESIMSMHELSSLIWILWAFSDGHDGKPEGFVVAVSSEYGGELLYILLSRAYALVTTADASRNDLDEWQRVYEPFFEEMLAHLGECFAQSENVDRTWEITAMLDALTPAPWRESLHAGITTLLRSGSVGPPKAATPTS